MRYTLRNKHKISKSLGNDFLKWLEASIANHFNTHEVIEIETEYVNEPFPIIHVCNVQPHTDSFYELYVISITFDVYLLAYKSCCG
jgi:hypothetical protein